MDVFEEVFKLIFTKLYDEIKSQKDKTIINHQNAERMVIVLQEFGFDMPQLSPDLFLQEDKIIRMGVPPIRIEVFTTISGVTFDPCYAERIVDIMDGIEVNLISLPHLKINKQASARYKDLDDLEHLP